jgi:hypothetical protein
MDTSLQSKMIMEEVDETTQSWLIININ